MQSTLEKLSSMRLVPVVVINDVKDAVPLSQALYEGGLPSAEITLRTPAAIDAIKAISCAVPDMLLGAGTVLTIAQVDAAVNAGAKYIVSPGLNPTVVKYCQSQNILIIPGVCTPSEVECGLSLGLNALKFFPAEAAGGVTMLKALSGPYSDVKFMPTGGISQENLRHYIVLKNVFACGGSWMVKDEFVKSGDFSKITEHTKEAVRLLSN